ncbi:Nif11-like leader peptide family natural product precursor [Synechococcus sp. BMK-MC-1]|uniref:Nif11-like leader peptide family natural product precursor n=1 Tax=Synechococcus sp. BMK-MC-1 TaxID=1442551 RepID=UPI0016488B88|nr:Nif11-like leader peptide family natural product precursor [Synechococcus sp. BMK-MC-1]QNI66374.1 putative nif11-like leader peptide domain protein [Synechococcus sp. BMK-MC-1]
MTSALETFVDALERSPEHQQRVSEATTPEQITALAADLDYSVSARDLRAVSRDLCATWWPWSEKGHAWRRGFFGG